jgi:hypothetical protein
MSAASRTEQQLLSVACFAITLSVARGVTTAGGQRFLEPESATYKALQRANTAIYTHSGTAFLRFAGNKLSLKKSAMLLGCLGLLGHVARN